MVPENNEFLLHLYDKLWENMNTKETRLWNFLSIYGAVIALAFAAGQFAGAEVYVMVLVLLLSTWAVLIVANANWWFQRNRLLVSQIEGKFPEAVKGIIPSSYREPNFELDRLYKASALILTTVAVLLYLRTMQRFSGPGLISDSGTAIGLCLLYFLSVLAVGFCLSQYETYFKTFYRRAVLDIAADLEQGKPIAAIQNELVKKELEKRTSLSWRRPALCVVAILTFAFDFVCWRNAPGQTCVKILGIASQLVAVVLFLFHTRAFGNQNSSWSDAEKYYLSLFQRPRLKREWQPAALVQAIVVLVILSVGTFAWALNASNRVFADLTGGAPGITRERIDAKLSELEKRLGKSSSELLELQRNNLTLQKELLEEKLVGYMKTNDADSKYLTRKEAELIFLPKAEYERMRENKKSEPH